MSSSTIPWNNILWGLSFVLQAGVLVVLILRRKAWALLPFASLLAFYLLRSLLLAALFHHLPPSGYAMTYNLLAFPDLLLQAWVAWLLFQRAGRVPAPVTFTRGLAVFAGLTFVSLVLTYFLAAAVHANPRTPVDRGVVFTGILMLALAAASVWTRFTPDLRRLMQGFSALACIAIAAQIARTLAAFHRDASSFRLWSYLNAVVYLIVLLFWLVTLRTSPAFR